MTTMKSLLLLCLVFVACCSALNVNLKKELLNAGYSVEDHALHRIYRNGMHQIHVPYVDKEVNFDWVKKQYASIMESRNDGNVGQDILPQSYWDFIPAQIGTVKTTGSLTWKGECFTSITASLSSVNSQNGTIVIQATGKKSFSCSELYMFNTRESGHFVFLELAGKHTVTFVWKPNEYADVQAHGIFAFLWPLGLEGSIVSVVKTVSLFMDPYPGMVQANVEFLAEKLQWAMVERYNSDIALNISESDIKSGDYLAVTRWDGLDPLIMWGTGGHTGHVAMALWFSGELYVVESTETEGGSLAFWPPPYGIIRTPYQQWIKQAMAANFHMAILRLAPQYLSKFNETAANQWFFTVQGQPYGWHNFIFSFLDTLTDNLPRPFSPGLFEVFAGFYERLVPIGEKNSAYNMLIQGLNHRLNSNCTTLQCIYNIIDPQGRLLMSIVNIPEQDSWRYGGNYSMVCSVFVCEAYKNAGIFGSLANQFQCTEHSPKDTYQWAIFDDQWKMPEVCIKSDPQLPYCQVMGKNVLTLPGWNSITPYANMNNRCPSLPPVYYRNISC